MNLRKVSVLVVVALSSFTSFEIFGKRRSISLFHFLHLGGVLQK